MRREESPLVIKSRLLARYGRDLSIKLAQRRLFRYADQLQGCTLSVANNVSEAQSPFSRADFIAKLKIAQKEAYETETVCSLLDGIPGIEQSEIDDIMVVLGEVCRMLSASIATAKRNSRSHQSEK